MNRDAQSDLEPRLKSFGAAGLVLVPLGAAMLMLDFSIAGSVTLAFGWTLALAPIVVLPIKQWRGRAAPAPRRPKVAPTFILAAALSAAGVASQAPEAALVLGYIAVVWFYARWLS